MTEKDLEQLVQDKLDEAYKANEHPKKFFITENGRGVTDGGDLYNALLKDVMSILQKAMTDVLKEVVLKSSNRAGIEDSSMPALLVLKHVLHFPVTAIDEADEQIRRDDFVIQLNEALVHPDGHPAPAVAGVDFLCQFLLIMCLESLCRAFAGGNVENGGEYVFLPLPVFQLQNHKQLHVLFQASHPTAERFLRIRFLISNYSTGAIFSPSFLPSSSH